MGGISSNDTLIYKSMLYKYPISTGDSWQVHRLLYDTYLQEFVIEDTLTTFTCVATDEKFATSAGAFTCYVYHHRITIYEEPGEPIEDWDFYEYMAPGIGHVGTLIRSGVDGHLKWKIGLYDYQIN